MVVRVPDSLSCGTVLENTAIQWHLSPWLPPQPSNQELQKPLQYWSMTQGTQRKRPPSEAARIRPWSLYLSEGYSQGAARPGLPHEGGQVSSQGWPSTGCAFTSQAPSHRGWAQQAEQGAVAGTTNSTQHKWRTRARVHPGMPVRSKRRWSWKQGWRQAVTRLRGPSRMQANSRGGPRSIGNAGLETGTPTT